jgi:hypothetical protein
MSESHDDVSIFRPKFHDLLSTSNQEQYSELRALAVLRGIRY